MYQQKMRVRKLPIFICFLLLFIGFSGTLFGEVKKDLAGFDITKRTEKVPLKSKEAFIKWRLSVSKETQKMIDWRWETAKVGIRWGEFTNPRSLEAFLRTPREHFCGPQNQDRAYEHNWLYLKHGVTISGPHMVTKMTDEICPEPDQKVLEIGTGSGYQSAVLAQLTNNVYTIEIIEPMAKETDALYTSLSTEYPELKNIRRKTGDGYYGWEENAPFDRIIVTCGIDHIPPPLLKQLKPGGIMVIPVGAPGSQTLLKVTKKVNADGTVTIERKDVYNGRLKVSFIPFTAKGGKEKHSIAKDKPVQN